MMTTNEFNRANVAWAENILAQPEYTMPNGKSSHQVAYETLHETVDAMVDTLRINAWGLAR